MEYFYLPALLVLGALACLFLFVPEKDESEWLRNFEEECEDENYKRNCDED